MSEQNQIPSIPKKRCKNSGIGVIGLATILMATGCMDAGLITDDESESKIVIAHENRWVIPPEVNAIGDTQFVSYTGAGRWYGSSSCAGGLRSGAVELKNYLSEHFDGVTSISGYACRSIVGNSTRMSVHATGRALDIMIPTIGGGANNEVGDAIGNWLVRHAEEIGIQYIIWDRTQWNASKAAGSKSRRYGGSHAHRDHLHVELSPAAANRTTPWFASTPQEPDLTQSPACAEFPPSGGVVDNDDFCLDLHGPSRWWRSVDGQGEGSDLLWTNAFRSSNPSNWAQWNFGFEEAGTYQVEVYLDANYARFDATSYTLKHNGTSTPLRFDQSSTTGWVSLGDFEFSANTPQSLSIYDNTYENPASSERSIMVDAIRLTPAN